MDQIQIKNLEVFAKHGVFPEENVLGQKFVISAVLYTATREAGKTDDLTKSIHYGEISHWIKRFLEEHTYQLLETAAERLAEELLLQTERLERVRLQLQKPWAPIGLHLETVSVEIERGWHTAYIALGSNMGDKKGRGGSAPYERVPGGSSFGLPGDRTLRSGGTGQVSQWRNENPDAADAPRIAGPLK